MAKDDGEGSGDLQGEYKRPNAEEAFKIFDAQIKPKLTKMATIKGDLSQPWSDIKEQTNFPKKILNLIHDLEEMEDSKRDHFLIALREGLTHRGLFMPSDLVSQAQGDDGGSVVPEGEKEKPELLPAE